MDIQNDLIPELRKNGIGYKWIKSPKGVGLELDVNTNGRIFVVYIFLDGDEIHSIQTQISQPVDPSLYYQVTMLLYICLKTPRNKYRWTLMENGCYYFGACDYWFDSDEILKVIKIIVTKFTICEPIIEKVAHGKKTVIQALTDLVILKMIK